MTKFDLHLKQIDVKITLLHGELDETIFMKQTTRFEVLGKYDHVC